MQMNEEVQPYSLGELFLDMVTDCLALTLLNENRQNKGNAS